MRVAARAGGGSLAFTEALRAVTFPDPAEQPRITRRCQPPLRRRPSPY